MKKYYCDRCGKELNSSEFSNMLYNVKFNLYVCRNNGGSSEDLVFDVCLKCKKEIEKDIEGLLRKHNLWSKDFKNDLEE